MPLTSVVQDHVLIFCVISLVLDIISIYAESCPMNTVNSVADVELFTVCASKVEHK